MKDNFQIAIEFAQKAKALKNKHILQIILFGSVARSEDTQKSDIDIAIIHDLKDTDKIRTILDKIAHDKIQLSLFSLSQLPKETEILSALSGEGILLYGKPISINIKSKEVESKVLIIYDTSNVDKSIRMKLNRALHGSTSKSTYKKKIYITETNGVLKEKGIQKLAKAVILAEPKKAARITKTLKLFDVPWKEILVWR